jgi:hypothetical protein
LAKFRSREIGHPSLPGRVAAYSEAVGACSHCNHQASQTAKFRNDLRFIS